MQPTESFSTGRQLALLLQRRIPDRDWMFDLAKRAGEIAGQFDRLFEEGAPSAIGQAWERSTYRGVR